MQSKGSKKWRILMLVADQLQLDRRVLHEAASLSRTGHAVSILSIRPGMIKPNDFPENVVLLEASEGNSSAGGLVTRTITKRNCINGLVRKYFPRKVQELIYYGYINPAQRLVDKFSNLKFGQWDMIFAHDLLLLPLALNIKAKQGYGKVIMDAHELYDEQYDYLLTKVARKYWRTIENKFLPHCNGVMTVTMRIAEELEKRHALPEQPTVLLNACPFKKEISDRKALHRLYDLPFEREIVLCQGGITTGRSLEEFITAWQYISQPRPALVFLGFGHKDYVNKLQQLIRRLRLEKDVFLGKAVPPDEILDYTCGATLGLISNRGQGINNTDGGPNRLFEYIQARVPILAYEHNGVRKILEKTGTGWVVWWENSQHLAEIITKKINEAKKIPQQQLNEAAALFSWENEEEKLLELVAKIGEA